jgi:hypothetical protein
MLYVNDELVDLKKSEWAWLKAEFAKIQKMGNPLKVKLLSTPGTNPTGMKEPIPAYSWPFRASIIRDGMSETWVYTKNRPNVIDGELKFTDRAIQITNGELYLDPIRETDKIYFLIYVSGLLKIGFGLEDLEKEAEKVITEISAESALNFYLFSEMSPLLETPSKLRDIASSWNIPNAQQLGLNQLKLRLKDVVLESNLNVDITKRGIKEFVDEVKGNGGTITKFRALMQKAIDKKVIAFNSQQNAWFWLDSATGQYTDYIVPVLPVQLNEKYDVLFEYLKMNAQLFSTIEKCIDGNILETTPYSHLKHKELIAKAIDNGIKTYGKKRPEIEAEMLEKQIPS